MPSLWHDNKLFIIFRACRGNSLKWTHKYKLYPFIIKWCAYGRWFALLFPTLNTLPHWHRWKYECSIQPSHRLVHGHLKLMSQFNVQYFIQTQINPSACDIIDMYNGLGTWNKRGVHNSMFIWRSCAIGPMRTCLNLMVKSVRDDGIKHALRLLFYSLAIRAMLIWLGEQC